MRKRLLIVGLVVATNIVFTTNVLAATAASPPKGSYGCTIGSENEYAGSLHIIDATHYKINNGKVGVYSAKAGKLTFPSGAFHSLFRGRFYVNSAHRIQIGLTSLSSGFETEYCEFGT